MLSYLQYKTILLSKKLFFYLPDIPCEWDLAKGRFNLIYSRKRWVYPVIQYLNILCLIVQALFVMWLHLSTGLERYSIPLLITHSILVIECSLVLAIVLLGVLNYEKFEYINALVQFRHHLFQGKRKI